MHLKRFKFGGGYYNSGRKIDTPIKLEERLNLQEFASGSSKYTLTKQDDETCRNSTYEIFGMVEHMGSLNGGHYTT